MADKSGLKEKSLLPLYIFEILRKFSSKENPLSEKQIKEKINAAEIFKDSEAIKDEDRKIIPRHIRTLVEHFAGLIVPVETAKNKAAKWYYDSSKAAQFEFLSRNNFSIDEIGFLVDMIYSSKLVTEKSTQAFIEKLLDSLNEKDEETIKKRRDWHTTTTAKNENEYMHEIVDRLSEAIREQKAVNIEFEVVKAQTIKNACVYSIYPENNNWYVHIADENGEHDIEINQIKKVREAGPATNYDSSILDKLEEQGLVQITDKDGRSLDSEISNDTLFSNTRTISQAISEKKYLHFKDYKCPLSDMDESPSIRTVIPLTTIFKNGAYYLIAIEKKDNNESSVLVRIDLMEYLKLGTTLSDVDSEKVESEKVDIYLKTDPYIRSKTTPVKIEFYIKKEAIQRVWDEFGNTAYTLMDTDPFDNTSEIIQALGRAYPEHFTKSFSGFEYGDELVEVEAEATEDDALRWALENADVVEFKSPEHLRVKLLGLAKDFTTRYSKSPYDVQEECYRKVITGEEFLTYGARTTYEESTRNRIMSENDFDKVTKLKIKKTDECIPIDELEKYSNIEELIIDGNGVDDFTWIAKLTSLRRLTLKNTTIESGDVLSKIPHLDALFLNENRCLQNYDFLIDMDVKTLCLGFNGSADISPLYKLKKTERLILKESMLLDIDIEKMRGLNEDNIKNRRHIMIQRWIDDSGLGEWPKAYHINYKFLTQRN